LAYVNSVTAVSTGAPSVPPASVPSSRAAESYLRRANNLPSRGRDPRPLHKRILTSPWTWVTVAAVVLYATALFDIYQGLVKTVQVPGGEVPGLSNAALRQGASYAAPTLAFWVVVYLIADRFRPQRPLVWFLALGWGGCGAVWISANVNTWAAYLMAVTGSGDPASAARPAVFVAPFVEEAMKATVLFWLAILARYRLTSKASLITLGGLSAAGFAFTENILYYARTITYSSITIDVGDAKAAIAQQVLIRGVLTAFGHPLFTMMTATGLAIAIRTRSKVVRILAPLAGYLLAAFLHMVFNSQATLQSISGFLTFIFFVAFPIVLVAVIYAVWQEIAQSRLIRSRLTDYVRMGWLAERDPVVFSRLRTRFHALVVALTRGWTCWLATVRIQRAMTEMAFLRDAEARGIVDAAANLRAQDLLLTIRANRSVAVADPRGQRLNLPHLSLPALFRRPRRPDSNGFGGWPTPGAGNGAVTGYSAVDPSWGPPPG